MRQYPELVTSWANGLTTEEWP